MSINKLISVKEPVVEVMEDLGLDQDKNIPVFTRWALEAENEIGSSFQWVTKRMVLTIENCVACLPSDAMYVDIAIMGDLGCDCGDLNALYCDPTINLSSTYGTVSNTFLVVDLGDAASGGSLRGLVDYSIQNNKMVFTQNYDTQKVTVQYLAPETDCDGFVMIGQNHKLAIQWYIKWKYFYRRQTQNSSWDWGRMNKAEEEWHRECRSARAKDAVLTDSQRRNIVNMWHNPFAGISLTAGMNTTLGGLYNI